MRAWWRTRRCSAAETTEALNLGVASVSDGEGRALTAVQPETHGMKQARKASALAVQEAMLPTFSETRP